jgi:hypothetical protein
VITVASFRADFPELSNVGVYPSSQIEFYQNMASLLLRKQRWGQPTPFHEVTLALQSGGTGYIVGEVIRALGGTYSTPLTITVATVGGAGEILTYSVSNAGAYTVVPSNPISTESVEGDGLGATFDATWSAAPNSIYDIAMELFIAHNVVLEARAQQEANVGGVPGTTTGPVSGKTVDKVSLQYDTASGLNPKDTHWNLTIYGTRLAWLMNMYGMGPMYVAPGCGPGRYNGPAWQGPWLGPNGSTSS